jgi:hypothetical protein
MSNIQKTTIEEREAGAARKPRAQYQKPEILKEGNLKKITALSFQPPA